MKLIQIVEAQAVCEMCGANAETGRLCANCAVENVRERCPTCDAPMLRLRELVGRPCGQCVAAEMWLKVSAATQTRVDEFIANGQHLHAALALHAEPDIELELPLILDLLARRSKDPGPGEPAGRGSAASI